MSFGKRRATAGSGWSCTEPGCTGGAYTASPDSGNTSGRLRGPRRDYAESNARHLKHRVNGLGDGFRLLLWTTSSSGFSPCHTTRSVGRFCSASRIAACQFPGRSSKLVGVEQRLVELPALKVAHLHERRVADDLRDAAAEVGESGLAQSVDPGGILGGRCHRRTCAYPFASATTSKRPSGSARTAQLNDSEGRSSFSRFALRRARAWSFVTIATAIGVSLALGVNVRRNRSRASRRQRHSVGPRP